MASPAVKTKWKMAGDYIQACNCAYGCPCEFEARPTEGFCFGGGAVKISEGKHGDTDLNGLCWGFIAKWPGAIHEGNGAAAIYVDEKASEGQRGALLDIISGNAGGIPFEILATTFSTVYDPRFVPFEFEVKDKYHARFKAGDYVEFETEPIKNPVTGEEEHMRVEHETGFIFKGAEVVSAKKATLKDPDLGTADFTGKGGFVTKVSYSN